MKKWILFIPLLIFLTGFVWAQEEAEFITEVRPEAKAARIGVPGTITFSFKDADIRNVLRLIAAKAGINIVYGPDVTGVVNMELRDVPWEQALYLVLDLNGYAYQKEKNVIKVIKKEALEAEPLTKKIFYLKYQSAVPRKEIRKVFDPAEGEWVEKEVEVKDIVPVLEPLLSARGVIKGDEMSNSLLVMDLTRNINEIGECIKELDNPPFQVLIEVKVVETGDTFVKDLGIKWKSLKEYKLKLGDLSRTYRSVRRGGEGMWDGSTENVDTEGREDVYEEIDEDIVERNYDYLGDPIEATVGETVEYSLTDTLRDTLTQTLSRTLLKGDLRTAILSADDFEIVLSALESQTDTEVISNPRVVTTNNTEASIFIGTSYPIPEYTYNENVARYVITGYEYKDIGVKFLVKPLICEEEGKVKMFVTPEVSKIVGEQDFEGFEIPIIGKKTSATEVILDTGDTLAIGGLIDEDKADIVTKIPLLGDIPILGRLFRHKDVDNVKKEIIFFITAVIIDEETKSIISEVQPVPSGEVKVAPPSNIAKKMGSNPDVDLTSGNKGYINSNQ